MWAKHHHKAELLKAGSGVAGFFLRFEIARTIVAIAGTKNGGGAAILAFSAKSG